MTKIILDKYQKKVIKNKSQNLLVIAGAGSGKTLTIIYKIKELIKKDIKEKEILCITYTKEAATSLKEKLKKEKIYLEVKTFHGLGYQIIRNSQKTSIIDDKFLDELIMKYLSNYPKLNLLINAPFKNLGKGNFDQLQNSILKNTIYITYLKENIKTFINLFKSNNYNIEDFNKFMKQNKKENTIKKKIRHQKFLYLVKKIYKEYEEYLKETNQIDFHDMINIGTEIIKKEGIYPYKYIIVDEYQDTSLSKCLLIKEIQNKTKAKLLAVGDDWQSIYRFTGSNLEIFTNFKKYFKGAKIIKLKYTYRNSMELLKVTNKFIMKNPYQIKKKIISQKHQQYPIKIYYYKDKNEIEKILRNYKTETFILGRNNKDINKIKNKSKNIKCLTVHKSKGLEAENVIIVNLENSITSFPSKIKENEYLKYVIPKEDNYIFAEERRLFYVALTRAKNTVTLLVKKDNPSYFVTELLKDSSQYIKEMN